MNEIEKAESYSLATGAPVIVDGELFGIPVRFIFTAEMGWVVPVVDISKALGINKDTQSRALSRNKMEFKPFLTHVDIKSTSEQVAKVKTPCLTRDGITMYLMKLTPSRLEDGVGEKISEFQVKVVKVFGESLDGYRPPMWLVRREAAKLHYHDMANAIKEHLITNDIPPDKHWLVYASEADLLNVIVFGMTAREAKKNQRNDASDLRLDIIAKLEEQNEGYIINGFSIEDRYDMLCKMRDSMLKRNNALNLLPERTVGFTRYISY